MTQKIIPHYWFNQDARQAVEFYVSVFPDSAIDFSYLMGDPAAGPVDIVGFRLMGHQFVALGSPTEHKFNASISMIVNFDPAQDKSAVPRIDEVWTRLIDGGEAIMPIGEYFFSKRFGVVQDRHGCCWQLNLADPDGEPRPAILPTLMFSGDICGKAKEAAGFYTSVFRGSQLGKYLPYPPGSDANVRNATMFSDFRIEKQWFAAYDNGAPQDIAFNEALSFVVDCASQREINYYWSKLSASDDAGQCGWLKDKFGVSWQIVPDNMLELMSKNPEKTMAAMMPMKKIIIADLERAAQDGD